jgi:hypothetical protein
MPPLNSITALVRPRLIFQPQGDIHSLRADEIIDKRQFNLQFVQANTLPDK